jgi:hypothetical protein
MVYLLRFSKCKEKKRSKGVDLAFQLSDDVICDEKGQRSKVRL